MKEYWEARFANEGAMWKFEPSDSTRLAMNLFKTNSIHNILVPGMGYGRNAKLFLDNGFKVTGIEISESAIEIAKENGLDCTIHHGSVTSMPFDNQKYDAIYCYALIHLLNQRERRNFLKSCYNQLNSNGLMLFVVASKAMNMYGNGKRLSKDRYEISKGLSVFFYDDNSVKSEFVNYGLMRWFDMDEPIKFMEGQEPMKFKFVICKKE